MFRKHQSLLKTGKLDMSLLQKEETFWLQEGEEMALKLFKNASIKVPAYKDFLQKNSIDADKINTYEDFQKVPPISKKNYLNEYPLEMLCWDGTMKDKVLTMTATSGSTGKPTYFPRDQTLDLQSSIMHEIFLRNVSAESTKKTPSTLVIVCFGMGVWIGGMITYRAFHMLGMRGYPLTIITPGNNKKEIFEALHNLSAQFDQIILCGYPPFIKDLLQEGESNKIDWKNLNLKFVFAAEAFSEEYRNFIIETTGIKNCYQSMTNIYGTADLGTMAMETPLSMFIRKTAYSKPTLGEKIFPSVSRTPTLAQFNPQFIQFQPEKDHILCTAYNTVPLIRYDIGDRGGVVTCSELSNITKKYSFDLEKEYEQLNLNATKLAWPFVYVYERADFSTKLYGAIIYPEHIREALLAPDLEKYLTGKFVLDTKYDQQHNQYLDLTLELRHEIREHASLKEKTQQIIMNHMLEKNSEYSDVAAKTPQRAKPLIRFSTYGNQDYFKPGIKHRWINP